MMSKRRRQKGRLERLKAFSERLHSEKLFSGYEVIVQESLGEKMSEVLLAFIEPYKRFATTKGAYEGMILAGIIAWNAALISEGKREDFLNDMINNSFSSLNSEGIHTFRTIVHELIKRKESLFPEDRRFIIGYELSELGEDYHLSVASIPYSY